MYLSIFKIDALPGQEHAVMDVLEVMKGPALTLPGCLGCSLSIETDPGGRIWYQERWRDREARDRHLRLSLSAGLSRVMELSRMPPEVEFYEVARIGGLDVVERARRPH